jgi:SAM-dependent methyltransferase
MSGTDLSAAYAPSGGATGVFCAKVDDYVRARPTYPAALVDALHAVAGLDAHSCIADIGAGTGLFTRCLIERGWQVTAVEPNAQMRAAADALLGTSPRYRSENGCAEATGLADASVDLVTAAQAFHWFDPQRARAECLRILRPGGMAAIIWNDRVADDPLNRALDQVFDAWGGSLRQAQQAVRRGRAPLALFFGKAAPPNVELDHAHALDLAGLRSLVYSRSYMPRPDSAAGAAIDARLAAIFGDHATRGEVEVRYRTLAWVAALDPPDRVSDSFRS